MNNLSKAEECIDELMRKHGIENLKHAYSDLVKENISTVPNFNELEYILSKNGENNNVFNQEHYLKAFFKFQAEYAIQHVIPKMDKASFVDVADICASQYGIHDDVSIVAMLKQYFSKKKIIKE